MLDSPASTSPRPGNSPAAVSARAIPPVCPLEPAPMRLDSKRATRFLGSKWRSQAAAAKPVKPPPTMAKSTASGIGIGSEWNSMVHGGRPHRGIRAALAGLVALIALREALVRYHRGR